MTPYCPPCDPLLTPYRPPTDPLQVFHGAALRGGEDPLLPHLLVGQARLHPRAPAPVPAGAKSAGDHDLAARSRLGVRIDGRDQCGEPAKRATI
eukprot:9147042-Pyramimonas_sp.AAC.2